MSKKKQSFLKSVKYSSTDGPTHRYNFDHRGKNVEIDIDNMPSGRQEVDFSYGGRMTRMGGDKTRGPELYKKIGKVIRAHDKLGRGGEHIIPHPYKLFASTYIKSGNFPDSHHTLECWDGGHENIYEILRLSPLSFHLQ